MTNLVLINIVEIMVFFQWAFMVISAPLVIVGASIYIVYELGWIGLLGPGLLLVFSFLIDHVQ